MMLLNGILALLCCGCENLTEYEFKQKYDWADAICTVGNFTPSKNTKSSNSSKYFHFDYLNKEYEARGSFPEIEKGYQYHILFDKNAPDKHYMILFHRPVKPKLGEDFFMMGRIQSVYKSNSKWKAFLYIKYQCYSIGDNKWLKYAEAIPLEYYDALNQIKENKDDIMVDCYITKDYADGRGEIRTFLNLDSLKLK